MYVDRNSEKGYLADRFTDLSSNENASESLAGRVGIFSF